MEFHDNYPQYEIMAQHSEEDGKKVRRTLWNVFWVMLIITIVELIVGFLAPGKGWSGTLGLKVLFIGLTLVKAGAIVWYFMHLGHEVKFFKYVVLLPYGVFMLYTIFIVLDEGTYSGKPEHKAKVSQIYIDQQNELAKGHDHHEGAAPAEGHEGHETPAHEEAHH